MTCETPNCNNPLPRYAGTGRKPRFCYECHKIRVRELALTCYRASQSRKAEAAAKLNAPPKPKPERLPDGPLAGVDRGTREGFMRYWRERPFHFSTLFPGMTVPEAWGRVRGGL